MGRLRPDEPTADPLPHPLRFVVAMARETVATVRAAASPFVSSRPLPPPCADAWGTPAVLVHGFMGHPQMLHALAAALLEGGCPEVRRVEYRSFHVDLNEIMNAIEREVRGFDRDGKVDLVGHSLGAIACRAYIKTRGGSAHVRRFVALGAPFFGTSLYRFVPASLQPALDPRGPWVAELNSTPEPLPTTVIRARYDTQVLPPSRASLTGPREVVLEGYGHNGLLWSSEAHRAVIEALTDP